MSGDTSDAGGASSLRRRLARTVEVLRGSSLAVRPYRPGEDGLLAEFTVPADEDEVERYWVNAPYAYVVITYDPGESEHRYYAVEPAVDDFTATLLDRVVEDIRDPLLYRSEGDPTSEDVLREELTALLEQYGINVDIEAYHALVYYLLRDFRGYGKIDPLLKDGRIEDISCDGYDL
ncbi:MAG: type II secretion system protein, partial [Haloplanus sp.]